MSSADVARRLLADEPNCTNCKFYSDVHSKCRIKSGELNNIPDNMHCDDWEKPWNGTWPLKVTWSKESLKAMEDYQGLDVEAELVKATSEEMKKRIDNCINPYSDPNLKDIYKGV